MLISELIVRHLGTQGALHEQGSAVAPVAGDLLLVSAPVGPGLREHVESDLPVGVTVLLLFEVEVADLPVGRVLAALAASKQQVLEAVVVSGVQTPTIAVVATRTDDLVAPQSYLAHDLEPGDHQGPAALRRVLGEHVLEGLVQRARERALIAQIAQTQAQLSLQAKEIKQLRADLVVHEATVADLAKVRKEAVAGRKELAAMRRELDSARKEKDLERKRMQALRSSNTFKLASRFAAASGTARRILRRSGKGSTRG